MDAVRDLIRKRLKELSMDMKEASLSMKRSHAYLQQFLAGRTPKQLSEDDRARLAAILQVSESELRDPRAPRSRTVPRVNRLDAAKADRVGAAHTIEIDGDEYASVPRFDVRVSAGAGAAVDGQPRVLRRLLFRTGFLREMSAAPLDQIALVEVHGESMSPTLSHGDVVLLDKTQRQPRDRFGAIYVIQRDDELHVKRINEAQTPGRWDVVSDNQVHATWKDCDPRSMEVIGRVFWLARRLR